MLEEDSGGETNNGDEIPIVEIEVEASSSDSNTKMKLGKAQRTTKKFQYFSPALCFDPDSDNESIHILNRLESQSLLSCQESCMRLCTGFQFDAKNEECILLQADLNKDTIIHLDEVSGDNHQVTCAIVEDVESLASTTSPNSNFKESGLILNGKLSGSFCHESKTQKEKDQILETIESILNAEVMEKRQEGSSLSVSVLSDACASDGNDEKEDVSDVSKYLLLQLDIFAEKNEDIDWLTVLNSKVKSLSIGLSLTNLAVADKDAKEESEIDISSLTLTNDSFMIQSTYNFDNSSNGEWCLQPEKLEARSYLQMSPCDSITNFSQWFFLDSDKTLHLSALPSLCVRSKMKKLILDDCDSKLFRFSFEDGTVEAIDYGKRNSKSGASSSSWLLGVKPGDKLDGIHLFNSNKNFENKSLSLWQKIHASDSPSTAPSMVPSTVPSDAPSSVPSECVDEEGWTVGGESKFQNMTCSDIDANPEHWCGLLQGISDTQNFGKGINEACCLCHGSTFKTTYPSLTPSSKPSVSQSPTLHAYPSSEPSSQPSQCVDEPGWHIKATMDDGTDVQVTCEWFGDNVNLCEQFKDCEYNAKTPALACCLCGGGDHQSVAPSTSPSSQPSAEPSFQPSVSSSKYCILYGMCR